MKKKIIVLSLIILMSGILFFPLQSLAVTSLSSLAFNITPKSINSNSIWTLSFSLPQDSPVGYILVSLAGYQPDLSQASLSVDGLPDGNSRVGKTNPSCLSNCDDLLFYLDEPVNVKSGEQLILTLNNVVNPDKTGQTGINFIHVFSSKYPDKDLAFSASNYLISLTEKDESELLPNSITDEEPTDIKSVIINPLFYKDGSETTKFEEIEDPTKVDNLTFDLQGKAKVVFQKPVDLSGEEAVKYIAKIADYMTLNHLYLWLDHGFYSYFKTPLQVTFYDLPYVWEPDIIKDDEFVLSQDELKNFLSKVIDDQSQISFIVEEAGGYRVIPKLELYIEDNQEIKQEEGVVNFSGRISDPDALLAISLNGKLVEGLEIGFNKQTGQFDFALNLNEGINLIEVEVQSDYGQVDKLSKIVNYKKDGTAEIVEKQSFNPLYYVVGFLILLAIILIFLIRYLAKKR